MRKLLSLTAAVTMSLSLQACTRGSSEAEVDLSRPAYVTADLPDDVTARVPGRVVVDFVDGTTKADIDAMEQDWGIDLEFNSAEEGPSDASPRASTTGDLDALLAKIRANPNVEAAEPLMSGEGELRAQRSDVRAAVEPEGRSTWRRPGRSPAARA